MLWVVNNLVLIEIKFCFLFFSHARRTRSLNIRNRHIIIFINLLYMNKIKLQVFETTQVKQHKYSTETLKYKAHFECSDTAISI